MRIRKQSNETENFSGLRLRDFPWRSEIEFKCVRILNYVLEYTLVPEDKITDWNPKKLNFLYETRNRIENSFPRGEGQPKAKTLTFSISTLPSNLKLQYHRIRIHIWKLLSSRILHNTKLKKKHLKIQTQGDSNPGFYQKIISYAY